MVTKGHGGPWWALGGQSLTLYAKGMGDHSRRLAGSIYLFMLYLDTVDISNTSRERDTRLECQKGHSLSHYPHPKIKVAQEKKIGGVNKQKISRGKWKAIVVTLDSKLTP